MADLLRRHIMMQQAGGILPSEYQQVDYIQTTWYAQFGGPYVDTGYAFSSENQGISMDCELLRFYGNWYSSRLGGAYATNKRSIGLYFGTGSLYVGAGSDDVSTGISASLNERFSLDIEVTSSNVTVTKNSSTSTFSHSGSSINGLNYYLFCSNEGGSPRYNAEMRVYGHVVLSDNGVIVRDLYPCYRKSDSVNGFYDIIGRVFYTNSGNGSFIAGNNV